MQTSAGAFNAYTRPNHQQRNLQMATPKYTLEKQISAFWNKVIITSDDDKCWLWIGGKTKSGYGCFRFHQRQDMAHRVAWKLPNYIIPNGMEICHSCDNPSCVNPKHLFLGTRQDNVDDMILKGRQALGDRVANKGESNPFHKLTIEQVRYIRSEHARGVKSYSILAREYSVTKSCIALIVQRKAWKEIE